jgi:hypothetical protein
MTLYFANPCGLAIGLMPTGKLGYLDTPRQPNTRPADVI